MCLMSPYIHDKSSWTYLIVNMSNWPERKVNRGLHYYGDMVYGIYHCQLFHYILHHLANYLVVLFWRNKYFLIQALDKRLFKRELIVMSHFYWALFYVVHFLYL